MKKNNKHLTIIIPIIVIVLIGIFITTNYIGTDPHLTSEQIKEKYPNSTCLDCDMRKDPLIELILIVLLPIIAIISIVLFFLPKKKLNQL